METTLGKCEDFKNRKSALHHEVESRGYIPMMSPKCHPELAGVGIEYPWGRAEPEFCRRINGFESETLARQYGTGTRQGEGPRHFTWAEIRETRSRVYTRVLEALRARGRWLQADGDMVKTVKFHRDVIDMEKAFLTPRYSWVVCVIGHGGEIATAIHVLAPLSRGAGSAPAL